MTRSTPQPRPPSHRRRRGARRGLLELGLWLTWIGLGPGATARTITTTYTFARPVPAPAGSLATWQVPGCDTLIRPGQMPWPFRTARVLLPPGTRLVSLEAQTPPGGEPLALPDEEQPVTRRLPPPRGAELLSVQRWRGCDLVLARVFPIQAAPGPDRRSLRFSPTVHLTLTLTPREGDLPATEGTPVPPQPAVNHATRDRLASNVDNPAILAEYALAEAAPPPPDLACDDLLVTTAALRPAFAPLLEQKAAAGRRVRIALLEEILAGPAGRDAPETLRTFLRQAQAEWGVTTVLLGGDTATIPCRYAYVPMAERQTESLIPCDLYYACLDGTWNRDGDRRWGEPTDGDDGGDVDLLADVAIGRAPVDTLEEAAAFVAKTVRYARDGHRNPASTLIGAEFLGHFPGPVDAQGGDMFTPLQPLLDRLHVTWLDDRPRPGPQWTGAEARAALNRNPHLVLYNGHAQADSLLRLRHPDLDGLTNPDPFLLCSVGCHAGRFDNDRFSPDGLVEELVRRPRHGAVAAVANARLGWFDPTQVWRYSGEFQMRLLEAALGTEPVPLGVACQAAREALLGQVETAGPMPYRWCYYQVTLLGDPGLVLTQPPPREAARRAIDQP